MVNLTISIEDEVYERVQRVAPKREWGANHKRDFHAKIYLNGLESPDFIKAENRRLQQLLEIVIALLKPEDRLKLPALEDLARDVDALQRHIAAQSGKGDTSSAA